MAWTECASTVAMLVFCHWERSLTALSSKGRCWVFIVLKCSLQCLATVEKYILDTYSLVNMNTHKKKKQTMRLCLWIWIHSLYFDISCKVSSSSILVNTQYNAVSRSELWYIYLVYFLNIGCSNFCITSMFLLLMERVHLDLIWLFSRRMGTSKSEGQNL